MAEFWLKLAEFGWKWLKMAEFGCAQPQPIFSQAILSQIQPKFGHFQPKSAKFILAENGWMAGTQQPFSAKFSQGQARPLFGPSPAFFRAPSAPFRPLARLFSGPIGPLFGPLGPPFSPPRPPFSSRFQPSSFSAGNGRLFGPPSRARHFRPPRTFSGPLSPLFGPPRRGPALNFRALVPPFRQPSPEFGSAPPEFWLKMPVFWRKMPEFWLSLPEFRWNLAMLNHVRAIFSHNGWKWLKVPNFGWGWLSLNFFLNFLSAQLTPRPKFWHIAPLLESSSSGWEWLGNPRPPSRSKTCSDLTQSSRSLNGLGENTFWQKKKTETQTFWLTNWPYAEKSGGGLHTKSSRISEETGPPR